MDKPESIAVARGSIKRAIKEISWWQYVQKEVQEQLFIIIEHIDELGVPFRDALRAACKLNERKRRISKKSKSPNEPSILFGAKLTEETYQAAKDPVICLLGLGEWVDLSEADVQACRLLCDHIEILVSYNVLEREQEKTIGDILSKTLLKQSDDD